MKRNKKSSYKNRIKAFYKEHKFYGHNRLDDIENGLPSEETFNPSQEDNQKLLNPEEESDFS